ncbi:MAG TPA: hypothetical protein VE783_01525 [Candidatus Limnocylindrales bacterium]|jgi:hypothetical protein|nr:hypothetical protein [Candidatus Limnocylindrales bacterium]
MAENKKKATKKVIARRSAAESQVRLVTSRTLVPEEKVDRVIVPEPVISVVQEKTYITTEPEVEIRRPATLAQALTEPKVAVVKPKTKVKKVRTRTRRAA